jgi:3-dehydroquinate synthase
MKTIDVRTGVPYQVLIGRGLLAETGRLAKKVLRGRRTVIVGDSNVMPLYGEALRTSLEAAGYDVADAVTFRAGEASKNPKVLVDVLNRLAAARLNRSDSVMALGGGVTGDMAGLAAALYQRGIDFVQIPTSLLAMVDSSVGGKTAVNLARGKNLMGAFHQPRLVVCDPECLKTLPKREMSNGWAEIIKYAMLRSDPLLALLKDPKADAVDGPVIEKIVAECVGIKRDIVSDDEFEKGSRALLNLGHTVGHAVERLSRFRVPHGRAVGIGTAVITRAAVRSGTCEPQALPELYALLKRFGLTDRCNYEPAALLEAARSDKKASDTGITAVLPEAFGRCRLEKISFAKLGELIELGLKR